MRVRKLEPEIKPLLKRADKVKIAAATMSEYGLDFLNDHLPETAELELLVGLDLLPPVELFERLLSDARDNWDVRVYRKKAFFHPKLYILTEDDETTCFVGSGNFTKGGIATHVEMFAKIEGDSSAEFEEAFNQFFGLGEVLSEDFVDEYRPLFEQVIESQSAVNNKLKKLKRDLTGQTSSESIDLESIDFSNQFFKYEHHNAFVGSKPLSYSAEVDEERKLVYYRLYDLRDQVTPMIEAKKWDLYEHHMQDHVVSSYSHSSFTSEDLSALWLHYGRSKEDLQKFKHEYGDNQTSMYHMRLQVLVHAYDIAVWLRVGKHNGSIVDRENFKENMRFQGYRDKFFQLVTALPQEFYVIINDEKKHVTQFSTADELHEFVRHDDIRNEYFIIGKDHPVGSPDTTEDKIAQTVVDEFGLLYPIYLHIRTVLK